MIHQRANPLWLCRASGHGRELSCGRRSHSLIKDTSRLARRYLTLHLSVHVDVRVRELELLGVRGLSGPVRPATPSFFFLETVG